jgi:hypothetical protein
MTRTKNEIGGFMRYEVYDEENKLFRKFWDRYEAERFIQKGWKLVTKAKHKEPKPTTETHGVALW